MPITRPKLASSFGLLGLSQGGKDSGVLFYQAIEIFYCSIKSSVHLTIIAYIIMFNGYTPTGKEYTCIKSYIIK